MSRNIRKAWQSLPAFVSVSIFAVTLTALAIAAIVAFAVAVPVPPGLVGIVACAAIAIPTGLGLFWVSTRLVSWLESDI